MITPLSVAVLLSLAAAIFLSPFLIRKLWDLLVRYVLRVQAEQGLVQSELSYRDALHVVLSVVVWLGLPTLFFILPVVFALPLWVVLHLGWLFNSLFIALVLLPVYFVLGGAVWLQWVWRWAARVLFPGAAKQGLLPDRIPYKGAALFMLALLGLYLLWALPRITLRMG